LIVVVVVQWYRYFVAAKIAGFKDVLLIEKSENHSHTIRKFYKDKKRVDKDWHGQKIED